MRHIFAAVPMGVKTGRQVMQIEGDSVRFARRRGLIDDARELGDQPQDRPLAFIGQQSQICASEVSRRSVEIGKFMPARA